MKFFSLIFQHQKPDKIRWKWLNSLKYELYFRHDSLLSRNDIGFYDKNGVEKNAMPLKKIFFRSKSEDFQMEFEDIIWLSEMLQDA